MCRVLHTYVVEWKGELEAGEKERLRAWLDTSGGGLGEGEVRELREVLGA